MISIHAPRAGARPGARTSREEAQDFNPRAPCGGATPSVGRPTRRSGNFNPRAPCGGATWVDGSDGAMAMISIHAPRAGARQHVADSIKPGKVFQSTRPVRGRDCNVNVLGCSHIDFNPRAPCGGATSASRAACPIAPISIHAPRAGARRRCKAGSTAWTDFNPRAPCGGATLWCRNCKAIHLVFQSTRPVRGRDPISTGKMPAAPKISIHAPRAGARRAAGLHRHEQKNFNPRAPCGGATMTPSIRRKVLEFQSTRPVRGRDHPLTCGSFAEIQFQSTRPVRGRDHGWRPTSGTSLVFQSTRPVRGRDYVPQRGDPGYRHFNPRAPCGGATATDAGGEGRIIFQSTRPVRGRDSGEGIPKNPEEYISIHAPRAGARLSLNGLYSPTG